MNTFGAINLGHSQKLTAGEDYYKPTMSQFAYEYAPNARVTFEFKNRDKNRNLLEYIDTEAIQQRINDLRTRGFDDDEMAFLAGQLRSNGQPMFSERYIDWLSTAKLPPVNIYKDTDGQLAIETAGDWAIVTFWETVILSVVNEMYFEGMVEAQGLNPEDLYDEGDRRLSEKIAILQSRPDISIIEFGTRRHFSALWQMHVLDRLLRECPQNVAGTSNVHLANKFGIKPIGTFAHELPMTYAGLKGSTDVSLRQSHNQLLQDWYELYGHDLSIALTDTFTSAFFINDFSAEQARDWKGVRHDSGDPVQFGEDIIAMYERFGIDPLEKVIVFSDGLDMKTIVNLQDYFGGRINTMYGWGTSLTNDLGPKALNIVMKVVMVDGKWTVKLSDNAGKNMGPVGEVNRYKRVFGPSGFLVPILDSLPDSSVGSIA